MKIGKVQRAILAQMEAGAQLRRKDGERKWEWYLDKRRADSRAVIALYVHGYIMFDGWRDGTGHYAITEQGKAAIGEEQPCTTS